MSEFCSANGFGVQVDGLTKVFGDLRAVDGVSFKIEEGELFGFLGPNGAGKTTAIKMLCTLLTPTSGSAKVCGYDIIRERNAVRASIGMVFQDTSTDNRLTGRENLDFHARMYGMDRELRKKRIDEVLELVDLQDFADVLVKDYSGGMERRLEIARGLMHRPKVLFLDEPTIGLDTQTRRKIWEYISRLNKEEDVTMLLTTHYMEEADYLCNRVAFIDHGKIVAMDTPQNLKNLIGMDIVSLQIPENRHLFMTNTLEKSEWIKKVTEHEDLLDLHVENGDRKIPEIMDLARKARITISSVNLHKPTLEDVFIHFTGKKIREEEGGLKEHMRMRMIRRRGGWH